MPPLCCHCDQQPATEHALLDALAGPLVWFGATPASGRACRDCGAGLLLLVLLGYAVLAALALVVWVIA